VGVQGGRNHPLLDVTREEAVSADPRIRPERPARSGQGVAGEPPAPKALRAEPASRSAGAAPGNPHRRFLVWGLLAGLMLVGFGYARDLPGFLADDRMRSLDQALAPFRNVHKFDVVLRIPLVLGLAHALHEVPKRVKDLGSVVVLRVFRAALAVAVVALLTPWLSGVIPAADGVSRVPAYWQQTADYLAAHDDGSVALELPAAPFGAYTWGNVHDDVLQGLADSPWAVRALPSPPP